MRIDVKGALAAVQQRPKLARAFLDSAGQRMTFNAVVAELSAADARGWRLMPWTKCPDCGGTGAAAGVDCWCTAQHERPAQADGEG